MCDKVLQGIKQTLLHVCALYKALRFIIDIDGGKDEGGRMKSSEKLKAKS
jgi:hypothetical protein